MQWNQVILDKKIEWEKRRAIYLNASEVMAEWEVLGKLPLTLDALHQTLGFSDIFECIASETALHTCLALTGPHGLTIAKVLLARRSEAKDA